MPTFNRRNPPATVAQLLSVPVLLLAQAMVIWCGVCILAVLALLVARWAGWTWYPEAKTLTGLLARLLEV